MTARLIDGKSMAQQIRLEVKETVSQWKNNGLTPGLAVILVGDDPASATYVRNKEKACQEVGIRSVVHRLPASTQEEELLALIGTLNEQPDIHGILVQLPLPPHIRTDRV